MTLFQAALILSTFLCSLVAGFLFAYAIVIMPGIRNLDDREFIRAFQVTDRVIQDNHPVFILVWLGSAVAILISAVLGFERLAGAEWFLLALATVAYLLGVQASTVAIHLPLNNRLQKLDLARMNDDEIRNARHDFEPRWNRSNVIRTVISACVSVMLMVILTRL